MKYDLDTFVNGLLEAKGLSYLDDAILAEMRKDLLSRIENRVHAIIASNMPEKYQAEFEALVDSEETDENVQKFCSEKIPNLAELVTIDLARFQDTYLGTKA